MLQVVFYVHVYERIMISVHKVPIWQDLKMFCWTTEVGI